MRPSILDSGHRLRARLFFRVTSAGDAPDIVRLLLYRPGFFARPLLAITTEAMRGPSEWSTAEREFLGMSIAALHACPYCAVTHTEMVRLAAHGEIDPDHPDTARPEVRAVRDFIAALHRAPDTAAPPPGVSDEAVRQALNVGLVWDIVNRLANAFGFALRGDQLHTGTRALHRFGYRFPAFLLAGGPRTDRADPLAALRAVAAHEYDLDEPARRYTALVRDASYKITDEDVARLAATRTGDEIFELTVTAAVSAALGTFDAGRRVAGAMA